MTQLQQRTQNWRAHKEKTRTNRSLPVLTLYWDIKTKTQTNAMVVLTMTQLEDRIQQVREALDLLRQEKTKQAMEHQRYEEELQAKLFQSKRNFARFQRTSSVRLHAYTTAIETVREEGSGHTVHKIPKQFIALEGQLCQSVHIMAIAENQLRIVQEASTAIAMLYQMGHDEVLRGKQTGEHVLMKRIVELDDETQREQKDYELMVQAQLDTYALLKQVMFEKEPFPLDAIDEEEEDETPQSSPIVNSFIRAAKIWNFSTNIKEINHKWARDDRIKLPHMPLLTRKCQIPEMA